MSGQRAQLDDLLQAVADGLATEDPLSPYNSPALDALTDALYDDPAPSPTSAFTAAKYVLAQHAREMAQMLIGQRVPDGVDARYWAAARLREHATRLDGQTPCHRCKGSGVDPENTTAEDHGDIVREIPEPCSACQFAAPAP
jgi:hypothetical protein